MISSFPLLNFFKVGSVVIFGSLITLANAKARDISCGNIRYTIETSFFNTNVIINDVKENEGDNSAAGRPYCQSNADAQMLAELAVKGDDIWCVKKFYISMDRLPIAKSSRLLSLALGRVFEYEYLWQGGDWIKTDMRTINCDNDETPERKKVLDRRTVE